MRNVTAMSNSQEVSLVAKPGVFLKNISLVMQWKNRYNATFEKPTYDNLLGESKKQPTYTVYSPSNNAREEAEAIDWHLAKNKRMYQKATALLQERGYSL